MAKLCQAPFIKVEATKFTEVGFHGKDVDTIIRDLVDISINMTKKRIKEEIKQKVAYAVEERILDTLVGKYYHVIACTTPLTIKISILLLISFFIKNLFYLSKLLTFEMFCK